jgi:predicted RNA-binding Zn-ribbon protein involved in translation (DUF1610 family)
MSRYSEIVCKTCGKKFKPKSENNVFCTRKCFKKDYYHRKKAEELAKEQFPEFNCPSCKQQIVLDFDPAKHTLRWLHYVCPGCNTLMINVSENIVTKDVPTT